MKKWVVYGLTILIYNVFLLILPIIIFLLDLNFSHGLIIDAFFRLYLPFAFFSPVLALGLSCRIAIKEHSEINWVYPIIINTVGFSPFWLVYLSLSSLWSPRDYFIIISIPVILGIFSGSIAKIYQLISRRNCLAKVIPA